VLVVKAVIWAVKWVVVLREAVNEVEAVEKVMETVVVMAGEVLAVKEEEAVMEVMEAMMEIAYLYSIIRYYKHC